LWRKWISFTYYFSPRPHSLCAFVDIYEVPIKSLIILLILHNVTRKLFQTLFYTKYSLRHWKALSARIHKRASIRVYGSESAQKSYKRTGFSDRWVPGIGPRKPLPEKATENCPPRVTFSIRASDSCRKLLTAEIVRQTNAWSMARVLECSDRFYPFHSLKSGKNNFSLYAICVEFPFSSPYWIEHFVLNFSFYPPCRVAYCTDCVQFCIEFC